ncbi:MAG: DUF2267 domain-containing protein [Micromonosporaceae bacterium]|nr:DUF2267 domain-containing protein [Micromonosporaceae bacterium]
MNEAEIDDMVARSGVDVPPRAAMTAVLNTLGEVLPYGVAGYLSANLPGPLRPAVGRHFPVDQRVSQVGRNEFMAAVVVRAQIHANDAERLIASVLEVLGRSVPAAVMNHVRMAVPEALMSLVGEPGTEQLEQQAEQEVAERARPRAAEPEAEKEPVRQVTA